MKQTTVDIDSVDWDAPNGITAISQKKNRFCK